MTLYQETTHQLLHKTQIKKSTIMMPSSTLCSNSVLWLGKGLTQSYARWYPSSSRLVRLCNVSSAFLYVFSFHRVSGGDMHCSSVISYPADVPCPGPLSSSNLFNHVCDLSLSSYPDNSTISIIKSSTTS